MANKKGVLVSEAQIISFNGIFGIDTVEDIKSVELNIESGTMVYLSTDGFMDQIGEQLNKKFLNSRFEKLLSEIHELPVQEQKTKLEKNFYSWKGKTKQIDDVLVIGFRV